LFKRPSLNKDKEPPKNPLEGATMQFAIAHSGYKTGMIEVHIMRMTFIQKQKEWQNY
jgi:hypothetical protein